MTLSTIFPLAILRLSAERRGSISIIAALCLPVIVGLAALAIEYGYGLLIKDENQRTADLASYAGALAYGATTSQTQMTSAALNVAKLNGIAAENVTVSLLPSPKDPQLQVVYVRVNTTNKLLLAPIIGVDRQLAIAAGAYASFAAAESACIIALDKSLSGVTLSGGVQVGAPNCYVASNSHIVAPCGTQITATKATYFQGSSQPCQWTPNIVKADGSQAPVTKQNTADPLDKNAAVLSFAARFASIKNASWPAAVSTTKGPDIEFGGNTAPPATANAIKAVGCTYDPSNYNQYWTEKWDITCASKKVVVGSLLVHGNLQVKFNVSGAADTVYSFSGKIQNDSGTKLQFGDGTFQVQKGVYGADLTMGAGSFHFGTGDDTCGDARYSLCVSGTVTIGGPSTFVLDGGFYTGGGATLKLGAGTANSYTIGKSSGSNAIRLDGGSIANLADASSGNGVFRLNGDLNGGGGGSCVTIPATAQHDISGSVNLAGGAKLGSGIYTIDGYLSVNTGGSSCSDNAAVSGRDVSILISGVQTPADSDCKGMSFCLTGGNAITLTAPKTGLYADMAVIGPQSSKKSTSGALINAGGTANVSGAFYFPYGPITFGGGGKIGDAGSGCLQLIGSSVTLSGGSQAMSQCAQLSGQAKTALIQ